MARKSTSQRASSAASSNPSRESSSSVAARSVQRDSTTEPGKAHKPQLKFVNSTNPDQLRTQPFRKLVKQHAMLDAQKRRREAVQASIAKKRAQHEDRVIGPLSPVHPDYDDLYGSAVHPESLVSSIQRFTGCSSTDPFRSLPQYSNPHIDAQRLQYLTVTFFPSLKRSQQYVQTLTSSPIVFLADAHPGMILQDALDDRPQGGMMTMAAKSEIYTLLNKRLQSNNPAIQLAPDVIAGIFNLILLENSYGNFPVVAAHLKGLRQMMNIIAGSRKAGFDPNLATVAVYQGLETAVYFEIAVDPLYRQLSAEVKAGVAGTSPTDLAWESPINDNPFAKTALSERCTPSTLWILKTSRMMTTEFLKARFEEQRTMINNDRALRVLHSLLRMPSSSVPNLPSSGDNVYECIRITAIIWCTAILHNIPLSSAVHVAGARMGQSINLVDTLIHALRNSGSSDCWGRGMIGAFMWVAKTGCAAVPNGSVPFKWLYLENARAAVHGLRHRLYLDILVGSETTLQVQHALRMPVESSLPGVG